jgi:hypothetical protein
LQRLLNSRLTPSPKLQTDGIFGAQTDRATRRFQQDSWLTVDGLVGPCTLNALRGTESFVNYKPPLRLIPQPTNDTCWAASTAMLTGLTVPEVIRKATAAGVDISGGLSNDSDKPNFANTELFAKTFGLTMLPPMSWLPSALATVVKINGPLMMDTLWQVNDYTRGAGSSGHMRVIAGMRGDGTDAGTTILLYDPWAPNIGKIDPQIYGPFIRRDPASTYQIFYR